MDNIMTDEMKDCDYMRLYKASYKLKALSQLIVHNGVNESDIDQDEAKVVAEQVSRIYHWVDLIFILSTLQTLRHLPKLQLFQEAKLPSGEILKHTEVVPMLSPTILQRD